MAEVCITSGLTTKFEMQPDAAFTLSGTAGVFYGAEFQKAEGCKCERCWKILPEVGNDKEHKGLCARCADAVRWYAKRKMAA